MKFLSQQHCVWMMVAATCVALFLASYRLLAPDARFGYTQAQAHIQTRPQTVAPTPTASATHWSVQLGAFTQAAHAQHLLQRLRHQGASAYTQSISRADAAFTKVFLGPFATARQAKDWRQRMQQVLGVDGFIVRERPHA